MKPGVSLSIDQFRVRLSSRVYMRTISHGAVPTNWLIVSDTVRYIVTNVLYGFSDFLYQYCAAIN